MSDEEDDRENYGAQQQDTSSGAKHFERYKDKAYNLIYTPSDNILKEILYTKNSQFIGSLGQIIPNDNNLKLLKQQNLAKKLLKEVEEFFENNKNFESQQVVTKFEEQLALWQKDMAFLNESEQQDARSGLKAPYVISKTRGNSDLVDTVFELVEQAYALIEGRSFILEAVLHALE